MTPREVDSVLGSRFRTMRDLICPDYECFEKPNCVYDSFAAEVVRRVDDCNLFESAIRPINDIAESKDPLLSTVLVISLLESIAADPDVARKVSGAVSESDRDWSNIAGLLLGVLRGRNFLLPLCHPMGDVQPANNPAVFRRCN